MNYLEEDYATDNTDHSSKISDRKGKNTVFRFMMHQILRRFDIALCILLLLLTHLMRMPLVDKIYIGFKGMWWIQGRLAWGSHLFLKLTCRII